MAMGKRKAKQESLWVSTEQIARSAGHPFYGKVNEVLEQRKLDQRLEHLCRRFYKPVFGRPSMAPGVYFRLLLIGFFEGIDSERGIAWRVADSLSLREFLGFSVTEQTPDHSTISRTRRLLPVETHQAVFRWFVRVLGEEGLIEGQTIAIDATTLEANAAMRSIRRRDDGRRYEEYLKDLAKAEGLENPTREQLARMDRKRKKKASNQEWMSPTDADARITTMKHTLKQARANAALVNERGIEETVADKGYHSNQVLVDLHAQGIRTYIPEPERGPRKWLGKPTEQKQVYANRRRISGRRGKDLQKLRSELTERSFAHMYETGGLRRTHLRKRNNILKRLLFHAVGFNLALLLRERYGIGKPRTLQGTSDTILLLQIAIAAFWACCIESPEADEPAPDTFCFSGVSSANETFRISTTGC